MLSFLNHVIHSSFIHHQSFVVYCQTWTSRSSPQLSSFFVILIQRPLTTFRSPVLQAGGHLILRFPRCGLRLRICLIQKSAVLLSVTNILISNSISNRNSRISFLNLLSDLEVMNQFGCQCPLLGSVRHCEQDAVRRLRVVTLNESNKIMLLIVFLFLCYCKMFLFFSVSTSYTLQGYDMNTDNKFIPLEVIF